MKQTIEDKLIRQNFEEMYNPLVFYSRIRDFGIEEQEARRIAEIYEIGIYNNILELTKHL